MPKETGAAPGDEVVITDRIVRGETSAGESAPGDYLLLDLTTGRYYGVGEVGGFIWDRLDGEHDLRAIAEAITTHFDVDLERARRDLIDFVTWLREVDLASRAEAS